MDKVGMVRVAQAREYGMGDGFVVEQFGYYNCAVPYWAIPAWDERGVPELADVFSTVVLAQQAIDRIFVG